MPTAYADANMIPSLRSHVTAYSQHGLWLLDERNGVTVLPTIVHGFLRG
jgi:hypothetical protein